MSVEVYLLCAFVGITLLGYMVAINSHGPTRLSVSYLIATLMLAGTVWAIVQHVNSGLDKAEMAKFRQLELEKQRAEERVRSQEQALLENKKRMSFSAKFNDIINEGTGLSTTMMNIDLRDLSADLEVLMGRAATTRRACNALRDTFQKLANEESYFSQARNDMREAIEQLIGASRYYVTYFRSEDTAQEEMRERMMRSKARKAYELFKRAASQLASQS
jgi:hypothetical protein